MEKKLIVVTSIALAGVCALTACKKNPKSDNTDITPEPGATVAESVVPIVVSETQYQYATNPDGSYETVVETDAEGKTHTYLKGIKVGDASSSNAEGENTPANEAPAAQESQMFEIADSRVIDNFIDILNSGSFSLEGSMTTDGETMPMGFMMTGSDIRMSATISGLSLDFASLSGKTYLICTQKKSYIELTDAIKSSLGLEDSDLTSGFSGLDNISKSELVRDDATYKGKKVDCFTSTGSEGIMKFYVDGDNLVMLEMYDNTGVCTTRIETTSVRGNITPADLAIPSDYEKKSYVNFIADVMSTQS